MRFSRRCFLVEMSAASAAFGQADLREQVPVRKRLLSTRFPVERIARSLLAYGTWHPFPTVKDRAAWDGMGRFRAPLIISGEERLKSAWSSAPATLFLEFKRNGNRSHYERVHFARREYLRDLVLAECIEGKGRFLDGIVNAVWSICEESFWGVPAHLGEQHVGTGLPDISDPIVDLFAAETSAMLAWSDYLLGSALDRVSPRVRERIRAEAERRVLTPARVRTDLHWMGLDPKNNVAMNNHTPWINSNWLATALLLEPNQAKRVAVIVKSLASLDRFLDVYHDDGGCDEGPGYWSEAAGALFDCLELLYSATSGVIDAYDMPLIREMGRYIVRAHIAGDFYWNFGDTDPRAHPPADLVYRYGQRVRDAGMQAMGGWLHRARKTGVPGSRNMGRQLASLFHDSELDSAPASEPLLRDVWLPGIQVMAARSREGSSAGIYLAVEGGNNGKSHNHNDVGNFIVYVDGKPVIIDIGVENYTAKTFSSHRYEIWTMQSAWHNLPTIGGVMQAPGPKYHATSVKYDSSDSSARISMDIGSAYPAEASLTSWRRDILLDRRAEAITLEDRFSFEHAPDEMALTLMTTFEPRATGNEGLLLGPLRVSFESYALKPTINPSRSPMTA